MVIFMDLPVIVFCLFLISEVFFSGIIPDTQLMKVIFIIYFIVWILLSILAKTEVAKLVNEVMSAITTILFTAGTYFMSMKYGDYTIPDVIKKALENNDAYDSALIQQELQGGMIQYVLYELGNKFFLSLLPYLCVSLFSIVLKEEQNKQVGLCIK